MTNDFSFGTIARPTCAVSNVGEVSKYERLFIHLQYFTRTH